MEQTNVLPSKDSSLASGFEGDALREIRTRDDKIRSLGVEINNLTKQRDELLNNISDLDGKISTKKDSLKSIDDTIADKYVEVDKHKDKVSESLEERESILNFRESIHADKTKSLEQKEAEMANKNDQLDTMKKEVIIHMKSLLAGINSEVNDFVHLIEIL